MKFPVVELIDRYAIAQVKFAKLNGINADEVEFYQQQLEEEYDISRVQHLIQDLIELHKSIWEVEDDFKKLKIDNQPLEEIGRRALFVRDLNNSRVAKKNKIASELGSCVKEHKSYAGLKQITFPDFHNVFDYTNQPYTIHYLDYSNDLNPNNAPDFEYRYVEYLQHSKDIQPSDIVIISNPYVCGNFQTPLVEYLNWFAKNKPNPIVMLTSRLNVPEGVEFPVYSDLFHEHACHWWIGNKHTPTRMTRSNSITYTSTKDYPERRYIYNLIKSLDTAGQTATSYSCQHVDMNRHGQSTYSQSFMNQVGEIVGGPTDVKGTNMDFNNLPRDYLTDSYASVIIDTLYGGPYPEVFFSEKIFNAIAHQQFFFYCGSAGSLAALRKFGYDTFDDIIDTGYDSINNDEDRIKAFGQSIRAYANRPLSVIAKEYSGMFDRIMINHDLFYSRTNFDNKINNAIKLALEAKGQPQ